ncbi:MAG: DNA primase [Nitrosopumilaceae archaeon]
MKYPFLAETGEYLRDKGFNLEQLGHPDWKPLVEKAYGRIMVATTGQIYGSVAEDFENMDSEILSFVIAVILLKSAGIPTLIKRFSLSEARRAERYLQRDLQKKNEAALELPLKIMHDLFSVKIVRERDDFVISVSDYLKHAIHFHEKEWKLINRRVKNGSVFLTARETVRLIRKELDGYINSKIQVANIPYIPDTFKERTNDLSLLARNFSEYVTISSDYPPCIKHAIDVLEKGENLPHSGRFMLATFLFSKGQTTEQIAPLFKNAPDYNERITRYQLEHIAGSSGKGTRYSCPSCDKLKSENLCFEIPECNGIINPGQFGTKRTTNA